MIKFHATSTICLQIVQIGPNGFVCPYCPKISKRRGHLEEHIRTHTGEKPFTCPYCYFSCAKKSNLTNHIQKGRCKMNSN